MRWLDQNELESAAWPIWRLRHWTSIPPLQL